MKTCLNLVLNEGMNDNDMHQHCILHTVYEMELLLGSVKVTTSRCSRPYQPQVNLCSSIKAQCKECRCKDKGRSKCRMQGGEESLAAAPVLWQQSNWRIDSICISLSAGKHTVGPWRILSSA